MINYGQITNELMNSDEYLSIDLEPGDADKYMALKLTWFYFHDFGLYSELNTNHTNAYIMELYVCGAGEIFWTGDSKETRHDKSD